MTIVNHVHMGWYSDGYHSPHQIWTELETAGIRMAAVSSTSTCAELYHNIMTEFCQLIAYAGKSRVKPLLWITPKMLMERWPIKTLLRSKIEWHGIKMHFISHPQLAKNNRLVDQALDVARSLGKLPVLFHTGEWESCHAAAFSDLISENPDLQFVLAHGRPIDETISIMKQFDNVWVDTAFMPTESVAKLKQERLTPRVMFGSDAPINRLFFKEVSTQEYLKGKIEEIRSVDSKILTNTIY